MEHIKKQFQKEFQYTDFQMRQIKFIFLTLLSEASKLLLLFIFFAIISKLPELLISIIALLAVRCSTGGIHLKHYFSCFLLTWGILFMSICILPHVIHLNTLGMLFILNICIITVYLIGPIPSEYRPTLSAEHKKRSCIKAATSILVYMYIIFLFPQKQYLYTGFWTILLQTLQLGLAKINLHKKGDDTL